jgi:hypothetical protein
MTLMLATLATLFVAAAARADDYYCYGYCEFGPDDHFDDNLIVTEGSTVVLRGSTVDENIFVYDRALLRTNGAFVGGNIQATGARKMVVIRTEIGGSVQLDNGRGPILIGLDTIEGNIQLFSNDAGSGRIIVAGNNVHSDVQIFSNLSAMLNVSYNVIDGNLQGESNDVPPTGRGNRVEGETDGQFEGF